jgi:hypothetical protein
MNKKANWVVKSEDANGNIEVEGCNLYQDEAEDWKRGFEGSDLPHLTGKRFWTEELGAVDPSLVDPVTVERIKDVILRANRDGEALVTLGGFGYRVTCNHVTGGAVYRVYCGNQGGDVILKGDHRFTESGLMDFAR